LPSIEGRLEIVGVYEGARSVINVDINPVYHKAMDEIKGEKELKKK